MPRGSFERTVAFRFLRGARGPDGGFLRFIVFVAIGGVAVGTGALLLAFSIVKGFSREIEHKVVGFGQHVQVGSYLGEPLGGADTLAARLAGFEGVERVVPAIIDFALLSARGPQGRTIEGVLLWGTPPDAQDFIAGHLTAGAFAFAPDSAGHAGIVLGEAFARRLGVGVGGTVTAFATRGLGTGALDRRPAIRQFRVAGLFDTGLADFDELYAYTDLGTARRFFGYADDEVGRFDLHLADVRRSRAVADAVTEQVGAPVFARSIYDVYRGLFAWVQLQQSIIPLVIAVLTLVAAFNIIGALLMLILDKTREIGILLGMGASRRAIRRLFLWLGFFVGLVGSLLGVGAALLFAFVQLRYGLVKLPEEAYYLSTAPIELDVVYFVLVPLAEVALCTLAAYLPASAASRIEPVRSIQFGA